MELIRPYELIYLIDRNCPNCDAEVDYNENTNRLFCTCCGKSWNYTFYKKCAIEWKENPAQYISKIEYKRL